MVLVPQIVDAVDIPVIAAGGIGDGRGVAATFMLGAEGVQIGTRFLTAYECSVHENYKKKVLAAKDIDTVVTGRPTGHPVRILKNKLSRSFMQLDRTCASKDEYEKLGEGALARAVIEGDIDYGSIMAGQIAAIVTIILEKIAFIFPGQGAQYIGMGKELYDNFPQCKEVFEETDEILKFKLSTMIFNGPKEKLDRTEYTQPGILTVSIAAYRALSTYDIHPYATAGLSLGEYSSLTISGVFSQSQVIPLVQKRGQFMQNAVPEGVGGMCAILGLSGDKIREACERASKFGIVEVANYNSPGQIVIGGESKAVEEAQNIAKDLGAKDLFPIGKCSISYKYAYTCSR